MPRRAAPLVLSPSALLRATAARVRGKREERGARPLRYRSVWISDVHLGTRASKAEELVGFLRGLECEHLIVVGDLIDGWRLEREAWWPASHQEVLDQLFGHAHGGAQVVYVTGNHDEELRREPSSFGPVRCVERLLHEDVLGRRWLVLHGDRHDPVTGKRGLMTPIGDAALLASVALDRVVDSARRSVGRERAELGRKLRGWMKRSVCRLEPWIGRVTAEARAQAAQGVVCGHFHEADLRPHGELVYANTGDWVQARTALVERHDGGIELVEWRAGALRTRACLAPAPSRASAVA